MNQTVVDRFWSKIDKQQDGCWEWPGARIKGGYGQTWNGKRVIPAHRFAYESVNGLIEEGKVLDHRCRNRACVRPDHLEPVTHKTNILRGEGIAAKNAMKTHCVHGHLFDDRNTRYHKMGRTCRTCDNTRTRLRKLQQRLNNEG